MVINNREDIIRTNLKNFMEQYGTSQKFISKNIGLHPTTVYYFLKGERCLSADNLDKLELFLEERSIFVSCDNNYPNVNDLFND